ncbi:MAG: hypothetical protein QXL94_05930 [Candidatus Parvarchaeum sp.]
MGFYYPFEAFWGIFEIANVVVISIISAIIISILIKHKKDRAPIFLWALDLRRSTRQLYLILTVTLLFIVVFSMYTFGEAFNSLYLILSAQIIGLFSYLIMSYIIIIWFKEFRRFI